MANVRLLSKLHSCRHLIINVNDVHKWLKFDSRSVPRDLAHEPENEEWTSCEEIIFDASDRVQPLHNAFCYLCLMTH